MSAPVHHPSNGHRMPPRPARLTIRIVEGRGIWIELDGDLTDGSLDAVRDRLDRLAQLGFEVVVVGARGVRSIDRSGSTVLCDFVDGVGGRAGRVVIVDPDGNVARAAERLPSATVISEPPHGAWWLE